MKRRFEFRLARIRRIRELQEHIARTEWGEAQAEAHEAEEVRDARRAELEAARAELAARLGPADPTAESRPPRLDPKAVGLAHEFLDRQAVAARKADEEMLTKKGQADRLAETWREKDSRRKALERLEDRDRHGHHRELEREDAKQLDERTSQGRSEDA